MMSMTNMGPSDEELSNYYNAPNENEFQFDRRKDT